MHDNNIAQGIFVILSKNKNKFMNKGTHGSITYATFKKWK